MSSELPSYAELENLSDREILIMVVGALRTIENNQINHLKHSWALSMLCVGAGVAGLVNIGIAMLTIFFGN